MAKLRILITGAAGQLGYELSLLMENSEDYKMVPAVRSDFDVANYGEVKKFIVEIRPQLVVHTAAFTAVDQCETQQDLAFQVNGLGARNVASASAQVGAKLVYISTDYVFDGSKKGPYREFDTTNPINVYGQSKLMGEQLVKEQTSRFFILRTAWLYGRKGNNFVKTMLDLAREGKKLRVVDDQKGSPTCAGDLAKQIIKLMTTELYGTYHCSSQGECTWYDFAREILKVSRLDVDVTPVSTEEFPRPAKRPRNSVLDNYMLRLGGLDIMPDWRDGLKSFILESRSGGRHLV